MFKSVKRREEVGRVSDGFTTIRKLYTSFAALFQKRENGVALKNAMDTFLNKLVAKYNFRAYVKTIGDHFLLPSTAFQSDVACIIYHKYEQFRSNPDRLKAKTGALLQIELDIFTEPEVAWFDAFCGKIYLSRGTDSSVIYENAIRILEKNAVTQEDVIATVRATMKAESRLSTLVNERLPQTFLPSWSRRPPQTTRFFNAKEIRTFALLIRMGFVLPKLEVLLLIRVLWLLRHFWHSFQCLFPKTKSLLHPGAQPKSKRLN